MTRFVFVFFLLLIIQVPAPATAQDSGGLIRWTDRRGVAHLTSQPPEEYEVAPEEWRRLKAAYPDRVKDATPVLEEDLEALAPGERAKIVLDDWWNLAGPRGAFRGLAVVSPEEARELHRLLAIARDAIRQARGTDLSPTAGRAAVELRRAERIRVVVKEPDQTTLEALFPVAVEGRLVRGHDSIRYEVEGWISNQSLEDAAALALWVRLEFDGRHLGTRLFRIRRIMAGGETPIRATFDLPPDVDATRLTLITRVTPQPDQG